MFLDYLREAQPSPPYAWTPQQDPDPKSATPDEFQRRHHDKAYGASLLDAAAKRWQSEREGYPSWMVCPYEKRDLLRHCTDLSPIPSVEILEHIDPKRRARVLYELAWRFDTGFWPIPEQLFSIFQGIAAPAPDSGLSKNEHLEVATILLRTSREKAAPS
jgi:hypothetical protein